MRLMRSYGVSAVFDFKSLLTSWGGEETWNRKKHSMHPRYYTYRHQAKEATNQTAENAILTDRIIYDLIMYIIPTTRTLFAILYFWNHLCICTVEKSGKQAKRTHSSIHQKTFWSGIEQIDFCVNCSKSYSKMYNCSINWIPCTWSYYPYRGAKR